jgi:DNA-binding NarL/FixJ family response regulator
VRFRCLVVDDNQRFLDVVRRSLGKQGVEAVDTATDSDSALRAVEAGRPDVVLVDVSLGAESGFDLMRLLVHRYPYLSGRIIVISTRDAEDYVELLEGGPAAGFVDKSALSVAAIRNLVPGLN